MSAWKGAHCPYMFIWVRASSVHILQKHTIFTFCIVLACQLPNIFQQLNIIQYSRTFYAGQQLTDSLVRNALSGNRGGNSGNSDGGILSSLRYSGLFNENTGHGASSNKQGDKSRVTVSGAGPGGNTIIYISQWNMMFYEKKLCFIYIGYPTQAAAYPTQAYRPQSYSTNNQNPNQGETAQNYNRQNAAPQAQPLQRAQPYGWSVGQN